MKPYVKIITFVFSIVPIVNLFSQNSVSEFHIPKKGDTFYYYHQNDATLSLDFTQSELDFSSLSKNTESVSSFTIANNAVLPDANLRMDQTIGGTTIPPVYFKSDVNNVFILQPTGIGDIPGLDQIPNLNGTLKYLSVPLSVGSEISSSDEVTIALPADILGDQINVDSIIKEALGDPNGVDITVDSIKLILFIDMELEGDKEFQIVMPDTTISTIQVVRTISTDYSVEIIATVPVFGQRSFDATSFVNGQFPIPDIELTQHSYYSSDYKQDILTATLDSNGNYTNIFHKDFKKSQSDSSPSDNDSTLNIYHSNIQSPILNYFVDRDKLYLSNKSNERISLDMYTFDGKKMYDLKLEKGGNSIVDISALSSRFIFLRYTLPSGESRVLKVPLNY